MDTATLPIRDDVLEQIKQFWNETIQNSGIEPDIHVNLLTPDGREQQPLAYDIIQKMGEEIYTITWVEKRPEAEKQMGLSTMTQEIAAETLRTLVIEAHGQSGETPTETRLVIIISADGIGLTYGRHRFRDGRTTTFVTNYQSYFTADKLLAQQNKRSGILFKQVTATINENGLFRLAFG